jgi:hypothetical protein
VLLGLLSACQGVRVGPPATQPGGTNPDLPTHGAGRTPMLRSVFISTPPPMRRQLGLLSRLWINLQRSSLSQGSTNLRDKMLFSLWVARLPDSWTQADREAVIERYGHAHGLQR